MGSGTVTAFTLFLRGLFLQAGWNRERMQALGFTFALLPIARGRPPEEQGPFIRRHLGYVNTSPALSGLLLGAVTREEERILAEKVSAEEASARTTGIKRQLEGPLAALGDRTFWGWLRPICGVVGVLGLFILDPGLIHPGALTRDAELSAAMAGVLGMLAFYNGPYLRVRAWATRRGLLEGAEGVAAVAGARGRPALARLNAVLGTLGPLALGALAGRLTVVVALAIRRSLAAPGSGARIAMDAEMMGAGGVALALVLSGLLVTAGGARFRQSPLRIGMGLLALLVILGASRG